MRWILTVSLFLPIGKIWKVIAPCASITVSIKTVLDTPILTNDGLLTDASKATATNIEAFFKNLKISI